MGGYTNPYIGYGWTPAPTSNSVLGSPLFNTGAQLPPTSALLSWAGANINQAAPGTGPFTAPTITGPPTGVWGNPGNLEDPGSNLKDAMRNAGYLNVMQGQLRNQLIPMFANEMFALATPAANFYDTLMSDNNSPFYQAKQSEAFNQGVMQNQNAAAQAQQQLAARGYGYTPSGANAAMIGAMNQAGAQNLAEQYLQNLFNNEQLRLQGAQGLGGLAGMFNPSPLFGNTEITGSTQGPSAMGEISGLLSGAGKLLGGIAAFCWVARAVYGEDSATAEGIRQRLLKLAASNPRYLALLAVYLAVGEKVAEKVKRAPSLRKTFRSLFSQFLANESRWPIATFVNLLCMEGLSS
ncbi:MAG TPA: hypothetical protein VKL40_05085 [Candidatus Angelobacter sp.]|nr:hypothetical protein [Candidatus Angelobacter sp.]